MLINADAQSIPLPDGLVNCIVTSPPYWSLRKYAGEQERDWPAVSYAPLPDLPEIIVPAMRCALGLEPDPESYVGHMVMVGRELWRVLRDDGVFWLNMGDSYARQAGDDATRGMPNTGQARIFLKGLGREGMGNNVPPASLKAGDLMMLPHRLALALQAAGWTIRGDCVWSKLNPMPESVSGWRWQRHKIKVRSNRPPARQDHLPPDGQRESGQRGNAWSDVQNQPGAEWRNCPGCPKCEANGGYILRRGSWRHTRSHEFVFMLTKGMGYFSNQEAVRETLISADRIGNDGYYRGNRRFETDVDAARISQQDNRDTLNKAPSGRNPRSVFSLSSENYAGAHYAVYPTALIAPLIRATTPTRCCPACGAGWAAVVERETYREHSGTREMNKTQLNVIRAGWRNSSPKSSVLGYRPTCDCPPHDPVPGIVFDPFLGSGTTARVARELGLRWVGADLSFEYLDLQAKVRTRSGAPSSALDDLPLFAALDFPAEWSKRNER